MLSLESAGKRNSQGAPGPFHNFISGAVRKWGGRASWPAVTPANPCPTRLGRSLALPISAGFEFFHSSRLAKGDFQRRPDALGSKL